MWENADNDWCQPQRVIRHIKHTSAVMLRGEFDIERSNDQANEIRRQTQVRSMISRAMVTGSIIKAPQLSVHAFWIDISIKGRVDFFAHGRDVQLPKQACRIHHPLFALLDSCLFAGLTTFYRHLENSSLNSLYYTKSIII